MPPSPAAPPAAGAAPMSFGRELRDTLILALPLIAGQLSAIGMNVVDTMLAGHYNAHTLAAVAVGAGVWSLAIVTGIGVMMSVPPSVAQLAGAQRRGEIGPLFRQALWMALLLGIGLLLFVRYVGPMLLGGFGVDPGIIEDTTKFVRAISWGAPALTLYFAMRGLSEGLSLTRPTMYFGLFGLLLLAPIGYTLMYGKLGVAPRGAQGSGEATALVLWIEAIAFALYLHRHRNYREIAPFAHFESPRWHEIGALLRLGVPMGIALLMESGLFVCTALLIASLGAVTVASHQVALNVASITFMVPLGLAMATTVRVGNAVGRGDRHGVRSAGLAGITLSLGTQFVASTAMAVFPQAIAHAYTDDTAVAALAAQLLVLAAIFQLSDGIQVTAGGALRGLKDTTMPMIITVLAYWAIGMPVGYWLAFRQGLGARGMWMGLAAGLTAAAVLLTLRFLRASMPRRA
ncbi:MATE family efflux transporter [Rudaea cellulosilytica]|uniref:MATE family efflux transporter n=1 Tax=Rudaea cellulosilytica TaxID=540746 RepID=UPI001FDFA035|nr:MATE family efflux transporter [Rudaea cellulosilytica]